MDGFECAAGMTSSKHDALERREVSEVSSATHCARLAQFSKKAFGQDGKFVKFLPSVQTIICKRTIVHDTHHWSNAPCSRRLHCSTLIALIAATAPPAALAPPPEPVIRGTCVRSVSIVDAGGTGSMRLAGSSDHSLAAVELAPAAPFRSAAPVPAPAAGWSRVRCKFSDAGISGGNKRDMSSEKSADDCAAHSAAS